MMGAEDLAKESLKNAVEYGGDGDKIKVHMQFEDLLSRYKVNYYHNNLPIQIPHLVKITGKPTSSDG